MSLKKIGVGVIGTGMAAKPHALALNDLKDIIEVKGVYSRNKEKCNLFAKNYNFITANRIEDISENPEIDMAIIITPPNQRLELVEKLRQKPYYIKLLNILVINGLLDIVENELEDGKIDYLPLAVNLISFLNQNKKYYRNFSADTFEKILILSIDEILTVKFKIDIDEKHITLALDLLRSSYFQNTRLVHSTEQYLTR